MGLFDFFSKGKKTQTGNPGAPVSGNTQPSSGIFGAGAGQQASETMYTVASGDSLSKIAQRYYGDAQQWRKIYEANRELIGENPDMIQPGQKLRVPR